MLLGLCRGVSFNPASDIPDLTGKVIVVTGGNSGLGKESVLQLCQHNPAKIYLAARTSDKYDAALADILAALPSSKATSNISFLKLDLSSLSSVRTAAQKVLAEQERLDILMNNAGIMAVPPSLTAEGYESQFGTNHIGHMLFTLLLLPLLLKTSEEGKNDVRVINLSSIGHKMFAPSVGILLENNGQKLKSDMADCSTWTRYGQSKLANILFAKEFAKRYPHLISVSIHPGGVQTNISATVASSSYLWTVVEKLLSSVSKTVSDGAKNQLWASTVDKDVLENGKYYVPVGNRSGESVWAENDRLAEGLWEWTEKELIAGEWWSKE